MILLKFLPILMYYERVYFISLHLSFPRFLGIVAYIKKMVYIYIYVCVCEVTDMFHLMVVTVTTNGNPHFR